MLRGLYTASSGMITQQRKHDAVTNNIANLNTPGYKQEHAVSRSFPEMLISLMNGGDGQVSKPIGRINTGVVVEEIIASFIQGDLQETMNPSDFALLSNIQVIGNVQGQQQAIPFDGTGKYVNEEGEIIYQPQAFFTVQGEADDVMYFTRNGKFQLDATGELLSAGGRRVLGQSGEPIRLDDVWLSSNDGPLQLGNIGLEEVRMGENGVLYHARTGGILYGAPEADVLGEPIALLLSQIDNPYNLIREGQGVFRLNDPEANPARAVDDLAGVTVLQGFIERSNVDPTQSMVDMMTAARMYEANQKVIQFYDRSLDKAVNEIGRV